MVEYSSDLIECLTLSSLDFFEIKDSIACDNASIPEEALISFGAVIIREGSIISFLRLSENFVME